MVYCGMVGMNGHLSSMTVLQLPAAECRSRLKTSCNCSIKGQATAGSQPGNVSRFGRSSAGTRRVVGRRCDRDYQSFHPILLLMPKPNGWASISCVVPKTRPPVRRVWQPRRSLIRATATGTYGGGYGDEDGVVFPGAAAFHLLRLCLKLQLYDYPGVYPS